MFKKAQSELPTVILEHTDFSHCDSVIVQPRPSLTCRINPTLQSQERILCRYPPEEALTSRATWLIDSIPKLLGLPGCSKVHLHFPSPTTGLVAVRYRVSPPPISPIYHFSIGQVWLNDLKGRKDRYGYGIPTRRPRAKD